MAFAVAGNGGVAALVTNKFSAVVAMRLDDTVGIILVLSPAGIVTTVSAADVV